MRIRHPSSTRAIVQSGHQTTHTARELTRISDANSRKSAADTTLLENEFVTPMHAFIMIASAYDLG